MHVRGRDYQKRCQCRCQHFSRNCLQVWDVRSKKLKLDLPGHADEVYAVDWSPDGSMVASGGKDRVVKLWKN